ncbi:MAG: DUF5686 and carboxypeptidase regulatory-like domain-containing protein [Cyclobacteriaceae bacterium]|nr:DUF5686 and carboxypeptidase regulatory-like domain-containing protein [Cyclobacteriaceae bacterium]
MNSIVRLTFLAGLCAMLISAETLAQQGPTIVQGRVIDASSGDPIPFVNVFFQHTQQGATTDFDGKFQISTTGKADTIVASYVGYKSRKKAIQQGILQTVNLQLEEEITSLEAIVVKAGENPAYEVLRQVVRNKSSNDKRRLDAYEYDSYTKIEIDVDNISDKLREKKIWKKISQVMDSVQQIAGEDGKPVLPIFISESVSKLYFRSDPKLKTENILQTKMSGLGVEDGTLVAQLVGSSFQEYNFYQNWLNIVGKDFASPIADGWRIYYDYDLTDSLFVGADYCYRLDFFPRSPQDLAFSGTMWITKKDFALKQIDVTVGSKANLNFVDRIKIQQELESLPAGGWIPVKNRILIDLGELTDFSAGMLAKFYTSNRNIVVNKPREVAFYQHPIILEEDAKLLGQDANWDTLRHEPLTTTEKNVYKMIDTLQNIPVVKTYVDIFKILISGYYRTGKVLLGPYVSLAAVNNIEGFRFQGGLKTNESFSKKWVFGGQLAYGFKDERVKYHAMVQRILSRRHWTTLTFTSRYDLGRVGVDDENLADNFLFLAYQKFGVFRRGYYFNESKLNFQRELFKGFTQRIAVRQLTFNPTYNFGYHERPDTTSNILNSFSTSEVIVESRYGKDEFFIQNGNDRVSMGTVRWPLITARYTHGIQGVMGSNFNYDKIRINIRKRVQMGPLGYGRVNLTGEYILNTLPYPLLALHLGNQSPIYTPVTYNLMNYGEFVSDHYVSLQYDHHFEGFLLNHIPLIRKLKWRMVGTANVVMGGLRQDNRTLIAKTTADGAQTLRAGYLGNQPYVELGYGVENILKFIRVDFVHRMSYLNNPDARKFGVLVSFNFSL